VLRNTAGFVYYVSIAGITGTRSAADADISRAVTRLKRHTDLPVAVGFGIRNAAQAAAVAKVADGAVVGSALVDQVAAHLDGEGRAKASLPGALLGLVRELAAGVRGARAS
jgi:tryptophan synthase alpha chain